MVKPLLRLLPLAILIVALGAHAQTLPALDATARNWRVALNPWAQTVSLRFSIECDGRGITVARSPSPLQSRTVHPPAAVENADALLALVREWLPEAELQRDNQRKELVHIVEKSLSGIPDYVLNQKTSLNFAGTLDDLLNELEKQSQGRLARSRTGVTPMPPRHYDARVNIHASNQTYRDILSTALANAD